MINFSLLSAFNTVPGVFEWPKITKKYIITYSDALVYITAKILMQTFDYTKIVVDKTRTLQSVCVCVCVYVCMCVSGAGE